MNSHHQKEFIQPLVLCLLLLPLAANAVTEFQYRVIKQYPHAREIFTQGLEIYKGEILESAGQYGHSSLTQRTLEAALPLKSHSVPANFFAEGLTELNGRIYQLTWQSGTVFVYDANSFKTLASLSIKGEGWGLPESKPSGKTD